MPGTYLLTMQGASIRSEEYLTAIITVAISAVIVFTAYLYRTHLYHWIKDMRENDERR